MTTLLSTLALASSGPASGSGPALNPILSGPPEALLLLALPMLGVVLCTLCAILRVKSKAPAFLTVACLAGGFVVAVRLFQASSGAPVITHGFEWFFLEWGEGNGQRLVGNFSLYIDSLTILWMLFVTGLATLIALYASEYMSPDLGTGYCRFFAAFNLFVFSMTCLVMGDNLLLLFLGWEGVGLCSYLLIGYYYKKPSAVEAAKKAFILNRIGDLGLLMGIGLTFVQFGSIEFREIFHAAQPYIDAAKAGRYSEIPFQLQLIPILLAIGAFGKSAQLPLYVWLPDAMEGPTPVSALIHAATMVTAGVYLVARMYPLFLLSEIALPLVAWVGALTAFVAATIGMAQFDIKRIMAYSTVSQLGYMFAGLGGLTSTGAAFHVVTHAFFKALLFLSCGAIMHGFAGQLDLRKLSGLRRLKGWGIVSFGMLVGCLNLSGFPFTSGFFSKDMLIASNYLTPGLAPIGWILLITAGMTAYYTFRVFFRVIVGPLHYEPGEELHSAHDDHGDAHGAGHDDHNHVQDDHAHHDHGHGGHFHPHAPGWAINTVLLTLSICSLAATGLNFMHLPGQPHIDGGVVPEMVMQSSAAYASPYEHHSEAHEGTGDGGHEGPDSLDVPSYVPTYVGLEEPGAHAGTFLGWNPHAVLYYVSGAVGFTGIFFAFWLHYVGRTTAATAKADALLPYLGPIPKWAQHKWYVDEFYNLAIRVPILIAAHIFNLFDKWIVDGLVRMFGAIPRWIGNTIRPTQSGELHGYAAGMAAGVALLLFIVFILTLR
ncbi:MAG: NADH-quinone oxidoreductase subunit L [Phycisphaeraceae bacterium]|nr:NADH-quinone oxidoreductase subunit L [Phycisphaeraceae bacterium]